MGQNIGEKKMGNFFGSKGYKMVKISIICLIYKSIKLCDWVLNSIMKYTPMIQTGEAEFFFVANDPTGAVVSHLVEKKYPFILNVNKTFTEEELFLKGYGIPEYMNRVYKGYNQGILHARGERVVLINSDNYFSPDWLENLLKYSDMRKVISCTLVERKHEKFGVFPGAVEQNFGSNTGNFKEDEFIDFTYKLKKTGLRPGGAYMPSLLYKDVAMYAGLYPEGNIALNSKDVIRRYGDEEFFDRLAKIGVEHFTAKDSISYHLKEGEREDLENDNMSLETRDYSKYIVKEYSELPVQPRENKVSELSPTINHNSIINKLLRVKYHGDKIRILKRNIRLMIIKYFGIKLWTNMISAKNKLVRKSH
jgi:GT2 family glycosyltransferase